MSDLYERLLAKVAAFTEDPPRCAGDRPWFCGGDDYDLAVAATRAVLELHKPGRPPGSSILRCMSCRQPVAPGVPILCDTVHAIAEALGVETGDPQK